MKNIQHMENIQTIKSIHHLKSIKSQKIIQAIITGEVFFALILLVEILTFPKQKSLINVIYHRKVHEALITLRQKEWF